jgi:predicted Zn-dependent protease
MMILKSRVLVRALQQPLHERTPMQTAPRTDSRPGKQPRFVRTAKALLLQRRTHDAIDLLRRGLNLDPGCKEARLLLGKTLVGARQLGEARAELEKLLDRHQDRQAYALLARICLAQEDPQQAGRFVDSGLERFPADEVLAELRLRVGRQQQQGQPDTTTEREEDRPTNPVVEPVQARLIRLSRPLRAVPPGRLPGQPPPLPAEPDPEDQDTMPNLPGFSPHIASAGRSEVGETEAGQGETTKSHLNPCVEEERRRLADGIAHRSRPDWCNMRVRSPLPAEDWPTEPVRPPGDGVDPEDRDTQQHFRSLARGLFAPPRTPTPLPADDLEFDRKPGDNLYDAVFRCIPERGATPPPEPPLPPGRPKSSAKPLLRLLDSGPAVIPTGSGAEAPVLPAPGSPSPAPPAAQDPPDGGSRVPDLPDDRTVNLRTRTPPPPPPPPPGPPQRSCHPAMPQPPAGHPPVGREPTPTPIPLTRRIARPRRATPATRTPRSTRSELPRRRPNPPPRRRGWLPLWAALGLGALLAATVLGISHWRRWSAADQLSRARVLAGRNDVSSLRSALYHVRNAVSRGGRTPRAMALAAAIHAGLAGHFGESDLKGARALADEALILGADRDSVAGRDLALARAHLELATQPLPEALAFLIRALEIHDDSTRLKLLYAEALTRNREYDSAGRVLQGLPADGPRVLLARSRALWGSGKQRQARVLLQSASSDEHTRHQARLLLARFRVEQGTASRATLADLRELLREGALTPRDRAWAHLMRAEILRRHGSPGTFLAALDRALSYGRPPGDADFHSLCGRLLLAAQRHVEARSEAERAAYFRPREPDNVVLLARTDLAEGQPRAALQRLAGLAPDRSDRARLLEAEARLAIGDVLRARALLQRLPGSADRSALLARVQLARRQPRVAMAELTRAVGADPTSPAARTTLTRLLRITRQICARLRPPLPDCR